MAKGSGSDSASTGGSYGGKSSGKGSGKDYSIGKVLGMQGPSNGVNKNADPYTVAMQNQLGMLGFGGIPLYGGAMPNSNGRIHDPYGIPGSEGYMRQDFMMSQANPHNMQMTSRQAPSNISMTYWGGDNSSLKISYSGSDDAVKKMMPELMKYATNAVEKVSKANKTSYSNKGSGYAGKGAGGYVN